MDRSLPAMLRDRAHRWPEKTVMRYPEGKEFKRLSFAELAIKAQAYAAALRNLGVKRGDRVALQSENCVEWSFVDWGCQCLGAILVPIYPTLPADQTQFIVRDAEASLVISGSTDQQAKVSDLDLTKRLLSEIAETASTANMDLADWNKEVDEADPDDVATFIYTSGTTGNPKGVMLTHRNFLHVAKYATDEIGFRDDDTFLTFLPMSHVYERIVGQCLPVYCGATIVYSKGLASLANEMLTSKPTIMLCVPRFLEATMNKFLDGVKKQSPLQQKLFNLALSQGANRAEGKFAPLAGLLDKIVGTKIRARTGGNIRFFVSGGAALPPHVARFYLAFRLCVLQGYGLTETTGGSVVNRPENNKYWTVGEPLGMECTIASDGEILLRGPGIMKGYHNLPEQTAQAIDADGWFHTGDIGEFEGKSLKITDRKKDLLVLANGKNIAPQVIEGKLKESKFIQEVVLFGDGNEYVYGLVIPNFERLKEALGVNGTDEELVGNTEVKAKMKAEIDSVNKSLADFEKVKKHTLVAAQFSIETGELTPSLKVKRKVIKERFAKQLEDLTK
ncbi:MAG: AMP-binding protein [Fimbriimonadaceae bacterium]